MQARYRQSRTFSVRDSPPNLSPAYRRFSSCWMTGMTLLALAACKSPLPRVEGRVASRLRRCGIMGQLIRHAQQPVTGMLDQLRQHIVQMHATTSGLP
jgi:hypothetical protein